MSIPDGWEAEWNEPRRCWVGIRRDGFGNITGILFSQTYFDLCKDIECVSNGRL